MLDNAKLTLGLPTGRLRPTVEGLFAKAKINTIPANDRAYITHVDSEVVGIIRWIHPKEIPHALAEGYIDAGITGSDCYDEWSLREGKKLADLAWCSGLRWPEARLNKPFALSLVAAEDETATAPRATETIATDFPFLSQWLFPQAKIVKLSGTVESFVPDRYRFGITIVETGNTLKANGLREVRPLWHNWLRFYFRQGSERNIEPAVRTLIAAINA